MSLRTDELVLVEARVANHKRSLFFAYLFWFFLGYWGVHQFYLGRIKHGLIMLVCGTVGLSSLVFGSIGFLGISLEQRPGRYGRAVDTFAGMTGLGIVLFGLWLLLMIIDLFLMPFYRERHMKRLRVKFMRDLQVETALRTRP